MIAALRSEFRKLFTVRSTYFISALALAFVAFYAFYIEGIKAGHTVTNPGKLASEVTGAIGAVSIFGALIAILLFAHEYRYNTIMYTLTASNSRSKVLLAKILTVTTYAVIFSLIVGVFAPFVAYLGIHAKGLTLVPQTLHYWDLAWRAVFYGWGYSMAGLLIIALIRSQVAAIVVLFIVPSTVESLIGLVLKKNIVYLPFSSLGSVVTPTKLSPIHSAEVFTIYLLVGWAIAWFLFLRRDAN